MREDNLWTALWYDLARSWWGKLLIAGVLLAVGSWFLYRAATAGAGWLAVLGLIAATVGLGHGYFGARQWLRQRRERRESATQALSEWSSRK